MSTTCCSKDNSDEKYSVCDSCMHEYVYQGAKNILVTDEYTALGDKLRIFSSVGRFLNLVPDSKVHFLIDTASNYRLLDNRAYSPLFYTDVFKYGIGIPFPKGKILESLDADFKYVGDSEWCTPIFKPMIDYIEMNEIDTIYSLSFPFKSTISEMLDRRSIPCKFMENVSFFNWGDSGKREFLQLNCFGKTKRVQDILDNATYPLFMIHCRQRDWWAARNMPLDFWEKVVYALHDKFGGTVIRIGIPDIYYGELQVKDSFYKDTVGMYLTLDEQLQIAELATVVIDINSVPLIMGAELGKPIVHINKAFGQDALNVVDGLYRYVLRKDFEVPEYAIERIIAEVSSYNL